MSALQYSQYWQNIWHKESSWCSKDEIQTYFFKNFYITSTITEWNKSNQHIRNTESYALFRKHLLRFIRPVANTIFNAHNTKRIKLSTRLRVGFSHLKKHKFRHNFQDALNPLSSCGKFAELTTHLFLHCSHFSNERLTLI